MTWRLAVDIRGSALPSAARSKEESSSVHGVCLCVELSRGCGRSAFNLIMLPDAKTGTEQQHAINQKRYGGCVRDGLPCGSGIPVS